MPAKDFIVAIELGSSKLRGIAGRKNNDGSISVYATASEDSSHFFFPPFPITVTNREKISFTAS